MAAARAIRAVIIGAGGLIGKQVGKVLSVNGIEWVGTYNKRAEGDLLRLDIADSGDVKDFFSRYSPECVFHCANLAGGVDFCERNPEAAAAFHLNATKEIGNRCNEAGATLVFVSTDYVFDGTKGPYKEEDPTNPLNLYGSLKLEAERWVRDNLKKYLIIRTTNVYGWDPGTVTPNYIMNLYRTVKDRKTFNAPSFLWGNPTYVKDLADAMVELHIKDASGLFHIVGSSFINRLEWAIEACAILGLDKSLVNEIKQPSPAIVARPLKSWLSAGKFSSSYRTVLRDVSGGLKLFKSDMEGH
jgi:dTDP-4-dehydrorhamnose reductase